jgi:hypothetical protein
MKCLFFLLIFLLFVSSIQADEIRDVNCAFTTLIAGNDAGFIDGAIALGQSLINVRSTGDMILLYTPTATFSDHDRRRLIEEGHWSMREIIHPISQPKGHAFKGRLKELFNKLSIFTMSDYEVVVYLDADTLVLQNINELCFDINAEVAAVSRGPNVNAGILVVRPSMDLYNRILSHLDQISHNFPGNDQGLLNSYYHSMFACPYIDPIFQRSIEEKSQLYECARIPARYNGDVLLYLVQGNHWPYSHLIEDYETPKIIHYTFADLKPWDWWTYIFISNHWTWWNAFTSGPESQHSLLVREVMGWIISLFSFCFYLISSSTSSPKRTNLCRWAYRHLYTNRALMIFAFMTFQICAFWIAYLISTSYFFSPLINYVIFVCWFVSLMEWTLFSILKENKQLPMSHFYQYIWVFIFTAWILIFYYAVGDEIGFFFRITIISVLGIVFNLIMFPYLFSQYVIPLIIDQMKEIKKKKKEKPIPSSSSSSSSSAHDSNDNV